MKTEITIPLSPEQEEIFVNNALYDAPFGLAAGEKAWMLSHARKKHPNCKILGANLDQETFEWVLTLEI